MTNPQKALAIIALAIVLVVPVVACAPAPTPAPTAVPPLVYYVNAFSADKLTGTLCEINDAVQVKYCRGVTNVPAEAKVAVGKTLLNENRIKDQVTINLDVKEFTLVSYHWEAGVVTVANIKNVKSLKLSAPVYQVLEKQILASSSQPNTKCFPMPIGTRVACTDYSVNSDTEIQVLFDWFNKIVK